MDKCVWKKSFVSVIGWAAYFFGISAALIYYISDAVIENGQMMPAAALAFAGGFWGGILLLFLLCRLVRKHVDSLRIGDKYDPAGLMEGVLFIALIAAGLALRIMKLQYAGEYAAYYDVAMVRENGSIPEIAHGATFFYVYLLRMLFLAVGNKWIAGIWLQVVLQILGAVLMYLGVRRLCGPVPGLVSLGVMMLLPTEIMRGLTYSPQMLYFCIYAVGMVCVAGFLRRQADGTKKVWCDVTGIVFCGGFIALACYLDVAGLTLLLPVFFALHVVCKESRPLWKRAVWRICVILPVAILFFVGYICLDAYACQKSLPDILSAWLEMYSAKAADAWFWYAENERAAGIGVLSLMVFGGWGFLVSGKYQRFTMWIAVLIAFGAIEYFGLSTQNMDAEMLLLMTGSVLAGVGIAECLSGRTVGDTEEVPVTEDICAAAGRQEAEAVQGADGAQDAEAEENREGDLEMEQKPREVKYIDNPLPLPRKHIKKALDYSIQPQDKLMDYDIEVAEDDDFDI